MNKNKGFTLIEILIVVAILGILAAVAYPSYQDNVRKSNRALGKAILLTVATKEEQFFVNNNQYATTMVQLGYAANTFGISQQGDPVAAGAGIYDVSFSASSTAAFTAQAVPKNDQVNDTKCMTLTLTNTGVKTESGTASSAADCW